MKKTMLITTTLLALAGVTQKAAAQSNEAQPVKLIAVVNRANWCTVCKANGQRFGATLMLYSAKGVTVLMNDLTDAQTTAISAKALQEAGLYDAVNTVPRKGLGKMMQSCRLVKARSGVNTITGIVTFINPQTHRQIEQLSIATPDAAMTRTIDHLLANAQ